MSSSGNIERVRGLFRDLSAKCYSMTITKCSRKEGISHRVEFSGFVDTVRSFNVT